MDGKSDWNIVMQNFATPTSVNAVGNVLVTVTILPNASEANDLNVADASGNLVALTPVGTSPSCSSPGQTPMVSRPAQYTFCATPGATYRKTSTASSTVSDAVDMDVSTQQNANVTSTNRVNTPPYNPAINCTP